MRVILAVAMVALTMALPTTIFAQAKKAEPLGAGNQAQGKPIESWIKEMKESTDRAKTAFAVEVIMTFNAEKQALALPELINLHKKIGGLVELDPSVRLALVKALGAVLASNDKSPQFKEGVDRLIVSLKDSQNVVRIEAMKSLQRLGFGAYPAREEVLALAKNLSSLELRREAIRTLPMITNDPKTGIKNDILKVLLNAAETDPCYLVRIAGIDAITRTIGKDEKKIVADRMAALAMKDTDPMVKLVANLAVVVLNNAVDDDSVKHIADLMLKHPDAHVRIKAIETALKVIAYKNHTGLVPALISCLDDHDINVQLNAIQALSICGRLAKAAVSVMVGRLDEKYKPIIQIAILSALGEIGSVAEPAVGDVVKKLSDPDPDIQAAAITALGNMGKIGRSLAGDGAGKKLDEGAGTLLKTVTDKAVEPLLKKMDEPNPTIRGLAMVALGQIGDTRAIAPLLKLAADRNHPDVQIVAIQSIGLMGPKAADAGGKLIDRLQDKELGVRAAAIQALGGIRSRDGVKPLIELLNDPNQDVALLAVGALHAIGPDAAEAVNALDIFSSGRDVNVRVMVIQTWGAIRTKEAMTYLRKTLKDKNDQIVFVAVGALYTIGPNAAEAEPDLKKLAEDTSRPEWLRSAALQAIQAIQGSSKQAPPKKEKNK